MPAKNIENYSKYRNYQIDIGNEKVTFNGIGSQVVEVQKLVKDSLLNQFRDEPGQQDVFEHFNFTLRSENILSVEFDYNLMPFGRFI